MDWHRIYALYYYVYAGLTGDKDTGCNKVLSRMYGKIYRFKFFIWLKNLYLIKKIKNI